MARLEEFLFAEEFLFEGEQADEYRARKEAEKAYKTSKNASDAKRAQAREAIGSKPIYTSSKNAREDEQDPKLSGKFTSKAMSHMKDGNDFRGYSKGIDKITGRDKDSRVRKAMNKRYEDGKSVSSNDYNVAYDASRRHSRRHPNNESSIYEDMLI